jgi:predicted permease
MSLAPRKVELAIRLIWAMIGVNLILAVWAIFTAIKADEPAGPVIFTMVIVTAIPCAFWFFLSLKIGEGRNWARIVLLVLMGIMLAYVVRDFMRTEPPLLLVSLSRIVQVVLGFAAVAMVFHSSSRVWFEDV